MDGMSLLDVLRGVMLDPAEQAAYNADPRAYLEQYGYDDVDPADLSEAFGLVADTLPPDQAQAAWSAAAEPDDSTFGTVTQDFDGGSEATTADAGTADVADTLDDRTGGVADPADVHADADADAEGAVGPMLSFGEGDDGAADMDDPTFGEAAATGDDSASAADPDTETQGIDADADLDQADDFDSDFDAGGFDDDLADGVGDSDEGGLPGLDDNDVGGMDDLDDAGPDDLDIGSF
jgi:hypothetical protein